MPQLEKAKLQPVKADRQNSPAGAEVEVQFNPTSLKLKLSNQTGGGRSSGRQRRQHIGASSTVLTLELVFDTADETTGDETNPQPVSVRTKTGLVEQFVLPKRDGSERPPRVKFSWNELVIVGIIEGLDIDFDLFAPNGVPLRAKVNVSIKEQEPKYQFLEAAAGARDDNNTQRAGQNTSTQPGAGTNDTIQPSAKSNRSAPALEGETAAEFAARLGLEPAAWRGLDVDLSAGLTLEAGLEVGFSAGLNVNAGIGFSAGIQAGMDLSLEAAVGLQAEVGFSANVAANISADAAAGFAMSAAGGVSAAIETVKVVKSQAAAEKAVQAFTAPETRGDIGPAWGDGSTTRRAGSITTSSDVSALRGLVQPIQERTPLIQTGTRSYSEQEAAKPAPLPPTADPRAVSFGFGVPLRPLFKTAAEQAQARVYSIKHTQARRAEGAPELRKDPTVAPWIQPPKHDVGRERADAAQAQKRAHPCGILYSGKRKGGTA